MNDRETDRERECVCVCVGERESRWRETHTERIKVAEATMGHTGSSSDYRLPAVRRATSQVYAQTRPNLSIGKHTKVICQGFTGKQVRLGEQGALWVWFIWQKDDVDL
jgi:hypothetical protein